MPAMGHAFPIGIFVDASSIYFSAVIATSRTTRRKVSKFVKSCFNLRKLRPIRPKNLQCAARATRTETMFPPTSYQALEQRMRQLQKEKIDSHERLEEKFEAKRNALQAQKTNKFSTAAIEVAAQEKELAEEQKIKTESLRARQADEVQELRLRHASELQGREREEELVKKALVEKIAAEKKKLEKAFQDEASASDTQMKQETLELEAAYQAKIEVVKNDMFEFLCRRVQATEPEKAGHMARSPHTSHLQHPQPVHKNEIPAVKCPKDTVATTALSIRGMAEKRKRGNNGIPTGLNNAHILPPRNSLAEGTTIKRVKLSSSATNPDQKKFFQVVCFRHYKHGEHKSSGPRDLWESLEKKLYLHMGVEFLRPVVIQDGNSDTVRAASWYLEMFDVNQVQYYGPHCLTRFQMKSFSVWIRFKNRDILNEFLEALQQWGARVSVHATPFSAQYHGFPTAL
ncbi:hypothetical protein ONS96_009189 [Cadophora gregata f. sp. sojae]|nr:hypothetical protein ONS96_009189 [Cadophora gregata f. sp. sojae]